MLNKGKTALWIFFVMIIALSYAWSSFIRTGIITPSINGYGFKVSWNEDRIDNSPLPEVIQNKDASLDVKKMSITTTFEDVIIKASADDTYHLVLKSQTNENHPLLQVKERGDYLIIDIEHDQLLNINNEYAKLEVYVPQERAFEVLHINTSSGDILFEKLPPMSFEDFTLHTTSGNLDFGACDVSDLDIETISGNVEGKWLNTLGKSFIKTTSGQVLIHFDPQSDIAIQISTLSGNIQDKLTDHVACNDTQEYTTALGSGKSNMVISTISGDITLKSIE